MVNQEALIAEYSVLRQEISQALQKQIQFIGASLAVASAFIVYGFQAKNSLAFLAATITLLISMYIGSDSARHVSLVATYLFVIVEPKVDGLQWETMLEANRNKDNSIYPRFSPFKFSHLRPSYPIVVSIYALFSLGCILIAWLFLSDFSIFYIFLYGCISLILVVSLIFVSAYTLYVTSKGYRLGSIERWRKIEAEHNQTVAAKPMNN